MSQLKNFQFTVNDAVANMSLKEAVYIFLYELRKIPISKRQVKALIDSGKIHYGGGVARKASVQTQIGEKVLIQLPRTYLKAKDDDVEVAWDVSPKDVLYEDSHIIALNKPSGLSTQASLDPKRDHLYLALRRYLEKQTKSEVYVGLHHRLDVDTSGVVIFTKKKSANKGLGNQFEFRQIQKTYLAICYNDRETVENKWQVQNHLGRKKESQEKKLLRMESVHSGGVPAHTNFRILESEELMKHNFSTPIKQALEEKKCVALEAKPKTGRTHQIRVHLFEDDLPIVGDRFYFKERSQPIEERLQLHAWKLLLEHPITKKELLIEAPFSEKSLNLYKKP